MLSHSVCRTGLCNVMQSYLSVHGLFPESGVLYIKTWPCCGLTCLACCCFGSSGLTSLINCKLILSREDQKTGFIDLLVEIRFSGHHFNSPSLSNALLTSSFKGICSRLGCFWGLCSIPLVCVLVLVTLPWDFCHCGSVM